MKLEIGDPAPEFKSVSDEGKVWRSSDHIGKNLLVIFFFPAAMTGGCTAQAGKFRDNHDRLRKLGAEVVGISGDPVDNLELFKRANKLNFSLLTDTDGSIARSFGVPLNKGGNITREVDGKEYVLSRAISAERWTFIIDTDGNIAYIDTEVDAEGDSETVIKAIKKMNNR